MPFISYGQFTNLLSRKEGAESLKRQQRNSLQLSGVTPPPWVFHTGRTLAAMRFVEAWPVTDAGGPLATLLRAGVKRSSAFAQYLRESQVEASAVSSLIIDHSDSE